ncbi:MAG: hypothetical protein F6K26_49215 [Moorea sp. SIO2I5]|nr:hypothetical protein [Moorena sp. SIO2I5]
MANILDLINQIAAKEAQLSDNQFLAPCVRGGRVRTRVAGMIYTFSPKPRKFEGWGIFQPVSNKVATVVEEPDVFQLEEYWQLLQPLRLRLAYQLSGKTWLGYPVNESDARQRFGTVKPIPVHLVEGGVAFEQVVARGDGKAWWFQQLDRKGDPLLAEQLREQLKQVTPPEELDVKGLTPEMRIVYDLVTQQSKDFKAKALHQRDHRRLEQALEMGGGALQQFHDRGEFWQVQWRTANGEHHTSAISKQDLTVISSGICLSGRDRDFDLQSLVGVIEARDNWD